MTNSTIVYNQQLQSARVVSTSNISGTYFNGTTNNGVGAQLTVAASSLTIDGVTVEEGDRVLLAGQTSANQNGVYDVESIGSTVVLERSEELQCAEQVQAGLFIPIDAGTANAGAIYTIVEPVPASFGTNNLSFVSASAAGSGLYLEAANNLSDVANASTSRTNLGLGGASDVAFGTLTLPNNGLHLLDSNASHDLIIRPGSDLTADRDLTITTGDNARTLDISAANVTVSSFGATLVDDASKLVALTTLGVKRGTTAAYGGGGTSNAFVATGLVATDIVVATILASTNAVAVSKAVPTADTLTITFSADPGAGTTVQWIAIATV